MSWKRAADFLLTQKNNRNILGLSAIESDLIWRFFQKSSRDNI